MELENIVANTVYLKAREGKSRLYLVVYLFITSFSFLFFFFFYLLLHK